MNNITNTHDKEETTSEKTYLFIFDNDSFYEMSCGVSLKDAIWEMSKYTGNASELFRKSLFSEEFKDDKVDEIIELFNHWCSYRYITHVYVVAERLFPS